jgi:hypothetical protein
MISTRTELALDAVYEAFGRQQKPRRIDGCPCCTTEAQLCQLLAAPLRELDAGRLATYGRKAMTTIGSADDFRYFLPRLLELSLQDRYWWLDREILLSKLQYVAWYDWPETERKALLDLFDAAFDDAVSEAAGPRSANDAEEINNYDDEGCPIDTWLCALACAHIPLSRFLERLTQTDAGNALIAFHARNATALSKGKLVNPFWDGNALETARVVAWLKSDAVRDKLRNERL